MRAHIAAPQYTDLTGRNSLELWVRPEVWDEEIAEEVITADYYFMEELKRKGGHVHTCIDVGGHIGSFSALVRALWPEARITAYEASPSNHEIIVDNAAMYGFDVQMAALVGETPPDTVAFAASEVLPVPKNTGSGGPVAFNPKYAGLKSVEVQALPAADVFNHLKEGHDVIDLMKFDCEGSEGAILTALAEQGLMERVGWIRGEYHHGNAMVRKLRKALAPTHEAMFTPKSAGLGFFIAHNRGL